MILPEDDVTRGLTPVGAYRLARELDSVLRRMVGSAASGADRTAFVRRVVSVVRLMAVSGMWSFLSTAGGRTLTISVRVDRVPPSRAMEVLRERATAGSLAEMIDCLRDMPCWVLPSSQEIARSMGAIAVFMLRFGCSAGGSGNRVRWSLGPLFDSEIRLDLALSPPVVDEGFFFPRQSGLPFSA